MCRLKCIPNVAQMEYMHRAGSNELYFVVLADAPREERDVLRRIREALVAVPDLSKFPGRPILSVQSALDEQQPEIDTERRISLTW